MAPKKTVKEEKADKLVKGSHYQPNGLTGKQNKFVDKYIETGSATKAALIAYDVSPNHARQFGTNTKNLPKVQAQIQLKLRSTEAPIKIAETFMAGMDALKSDDADHTTRLKAAEGAAKLLGAYPDRLPQEPSNFEHLDLSGVHPAIIQYLIDHGGDLPEEAEYYALIEAHNATTA